MNKLANQYKKEIQAILAKYPPDQKRAAVMPLIYLAQRENNYITPQSMREIAEILGLTETDVATLVGFYTLYHEASDQPPDTGERSHTHGKYRIQVCTDLPCALRGAEQFLEKLCDNVGIRVGETTPDGQITIEQVTCLAGCDRAPMFQVQSGEGLTYHENQTVETALELINQLRTGQPNEGANVIAAMIATGERRNGHE